MPKWLKKEVLKLIDGSTLDYTQFGDAALPANDLRCRGMDFHDDVYFFHSCITDANRLFEHFSMASDTCILWTSEEVKKRQLKRQYEDLTKLNEYTKQNEKKKYTLQDYFLES